MTKKSAVQRNELTPIQTIAACAVLLAPGTITQAKIALADDARIVIASLDSTIPPATECATPEAKYFRAPPSPLATDRLIPCRLQLRMFDKTRVSQSCH